MEFLLISLIWFGLSGLLGYALFKCIPNKVYNFIANKIF